ncbi:hypothetical protein [Streptomyces mirabilis]
MPKENADADGYQRMMCPAEAGKAQCPHQAPHHGPRQCDGHVRTS